MAEKKIVFRDKTLQFQGLFEIKGLFRSIVKWLDEHNYDLFENKNYEEIFENDKKIVFELLPYKKITDYYKFEIRIYLTCESLKEAEVELNGVKYRLLKGNMTCTFDATMITDYENRWESKPQYFFFRTLMDKFIYRSHTREYEHELRTDVQQLEEEMKAYLNMFRYKI